MCRKLIYYKLTSLISCALVFLEQLRLVLGSLLVILHRFIKGTNES